MPDSSQFLLRKVLNVFPHIGYGRQVCDYTFNGFAIVRQTAFSPYSTEYLNEWPIFGFPSLENTSNTAFSVIDSNEYTPISCSRKKNEDSAYFTFIENLQRLSTMLKAMSVTSLYSAPSNS